MANGRREPAGPVHYTAPAGSRRPFAVSRCANGAHQFFNWGPIRWSIASVDKDQATVRIENEVAAELQHVLSFDCPARHPTAQNQSEVSKDASDTQDRGPRRPFQPEGAVGGPGRVGYHRKGQGPARQVRCEQVRPRETDDEDFAAEADDLRVVLLHLTEVRAAGDSGEVAEED
ncbi:MAG TPA: hypothetical protein VGG61_01300 [Gemmataceae bacterium]